MRQLEQSLEAHRPRHPSLGPAHQRELARTLELFEAVIDRERMRRTGALIGSNALPTYPIVSQTCRNRVAARLDKRRHALDRVRGAFERVGEAHELGR